MKIKAFYIVILFFALTISASAENLYKAGVKTLSGTVIEKGWGKSGESYCQGGSEYYVLKTEKETYTLNSSRDPINKNDNYKSFDKTQNLLKALVGKKIIITGTLIYANWEYNEHCPPGNQCTMGKLNCNWIRILNIKPIN